MKRSADVDNYSAPSGLHGLFEYTLAHVEGSNGIDVKDSLHSIGADPLSCGQEVASRPIDQDIDLPKLVHDILNFNPAAINV